MALRAVDVLNEGDKKALLASMDYREHSAGDALRGLVKTFWTLDAGGTPGEWMTHQAVPDGCVELIRRIEGRSSWGGEQPSCFAVGIIDRPTGFSVSGDSRFAAARLWPWAWQLLSEVPLAQMRGRWVEAAEPELAAICAALPDFVRADERLAAVLGPAARLRTVGAALTRAQSVEEMCSAAGMTPRTLQRWFGRHVGMPPRRYLRMLRFQNAFAQVPGQPSLADHAAASGFADQAHMAREFRALADTPPGRARSTARGPFLP